MFPDTHTEYHGPKGEICMQVERIFIFKYKPHSFFQYISWIIPDVSMPVKNGLNRVELVPILLSMKLFMSRSFTHYIL